MCPGGSQYAGGQYLLNNGTITEAYNLQGGIAEWHRSGLALDMD